jgi:hypothetical protein
MRADEQAKRLRADGITAMVALQFGTAECSPLRRIVSDSNERQGNAQGKAQDNVLGTQRKMTFRAT